MRKRPYSILVISCAALFLFACGDDETPDNGSDPTQDTGATDLSDAGDLSDTTDDVGDLAETGGSDATDITVEDQPTTDLDGGGDDTGGEDVPGDTTDTGTEDTRGDTPGDATDTGDGELDLLDVLGDLSDTSDADLADVGDTADTADADVDIPTPTTILTFGAFEEGDFDRATLQIMITNPVSVGGFKFTTDGIVWDLHDAAYGGAAADEGFLLSPDYPNHTITGLSLTGTAVIAASDEPVELCKVKFVYPPPDSSDRVCLNGIVINAKGSGDVVPSEAGPCYCFAESCD